MTRTLIYVVAAFALWLYFKYGTFESAPQAEKYKVEDFDKAGSGRGGTATVSTNGKKVTVNPLAEVRV